MKQIEEIARAVLALFLLGQDCVLNEADWTEVEIGPHIIYTLSGSKENTDLPDDDSMFDFLDSFLAIYRSIPQAAKFHAYRCSAFVDDASNRGFVYASIYL